VTGVEPATFSLGSLPAIRARGYALGQALEEVFMPVSHNSMPRVAPDDLRVGMWVVIVAERETILPDADEPWQRPVHRWVELERYSSWSRRPVRIEAVSLPFLAVRPASRDEGVEVWDVRLVRLAEATRGLVRACRRGARSSRIAAR
jgi:hypothetical protein